MRLPLLTLLLLTGSLHSVSLACSPRQSPRFQFQEEAAPEIRGQVLIHEVQIARGYQGKDPGFGCSDAGTLVVALLAEANAGYLVRPISGQLPDAFPDVPVEALEGHSLLGFSELHFAWVDHPNRPRGLIDGEVEVVAIDRNGAERGRRRLKIRELEESGPLMQVLCASEIGAWRACGDDS